MIRSKGEAGTGNIVEAVRHMREITVGHHQAFDASPRGARRRAAKEHSAPLEVVHEVAGAGRLPVPLFCAGGIATPADAALMMQLGAEGNFVGSGIFKSEDPERRARAIVEATTHYEDAERVAKASMELGDADARPRDRGARRRRRAAAGPRRLTRVEIGVLAVQGDFEAHCRALTELGAEALEVRTPEAIDGLDGLVIPGGESTTIAKGMERDGLDARSASDSTPGCRSSAAAPG